MLATEILKNQKDCQKPESRFALIDRLSARAFCAKIDARNFFCLLTIRLRIIPAEESETENIMQYQIIGGDFPAVICNLDSSESMMTEKGSMVWMSANMDMQTQGTSVGKAFGRMFSGESIFQNIYTAKGGPGMIAFGSSFPGSIKTINLQPGEFIIAQKGAFLAATPSVQLSTIFQKKMMSGFFSGEGFIMQKIAGPGTVFLELDGAEWTYTLKAGEQLIVDTGNVAMIDGTCSIDVQTVKGVKNKLFGGEGFFNTVITGPGKVVLQTMPMSSLANAIAQSMPSSN